MVFELAVLREKYAHTHRIWYCITNSKEPRSGLLIASYWFLECLEKEI